MSELISVIIPVYNVASYLPMCLDSVINQTYRELEILLVDDGSTDDSGSICDSYAKMDERIRVIHKKNEGVSVARNLGIEQSKGEYLSFIDSDDWIAKETYEILLNAVHTYAADCVAGAFVGVKVQDHVVKRVREDKRETCVRTSEEAMKITLLGSSSACNRLFRREVVLGETFPPGRRNEDEVFALHVYSKCNKVVYLSDMTYFYRVRQGSATHTRFHLGKVDSYYNAVDNLDFVKKSFPALTEAAECKYFKTMTYCYVRLRLAKCDERMKKVRKELKSRIKDSENRKKSAENRYLPFYYKTAMAVCRTPFF